MNSGLAKRHIFFVDDEAPIRELLALFFRKKGMEVTTAMNIEQAKELAAAAPFDLAILDVNLAGQNGLELLRFLRTAHPQAPVLVFTGLPDEDLVETALAAGACGVMRKTEPLAALYAEVCRHVLN
jgi:DNA-binding response OmpR family regulator